MEVESVQIQENGNRNGSFSFGIIITLNTWFAKYSISKAIKYLVWSVLCLKRCLFSFFSYAILKYTIFSYAILKYTVISLN